VSTIQNKARKQNNELDSVNESPVVEYLLESNKLFIGCQYFFEKLADLSENFYTEDFAYVLKRVCFWKNSLKKK